MLSVYEDRSDTFETRYQTFHRRNTMESNLGENIEHILNGASKPSRPGIRPIAVDKPKTTSRKLIDKGDLHDKSKMSMSAWRLGLSH